MTGRARVFISCGQHDEEMPIVRRIAAIVKKAGFEAYIGREEQTYLGLTANIFEKLRTYEYFLFIDFEREEIKGTSIHRGSLFSHQELAIAAFQEMHPIAFRQKGVHDKDGMAYAMQLNPVQFDDTEDLLEKLANRLEKAKTNGEWYPEHRNEPGISIGKPKFILKPYNGQPERLAFYYFVVKNRSKHRSIRGCSVFLSKCSTENGDQIPLGQTRIKWDGTHERAIYLHKDGVETLPAICVDIEQNSVGCLYVSSDVFYQGPFPICEGPGNFILEYTVMSENFPETSAKFRLSLGNTLNDFAFAPFSD